MVGHTHRPFDLHYKDTRVLNPGATCLLKASDSHSAAILDLASGEFTVYGLDDDREAEVAQFESR